MNRVLPLLIYGALFYFMMRYGCGAHMMRHHHHRDSRDNRDRDYRGDRSRTEPRD
jgi:hypothetical protein